MRPDGIRHNHQEEPASDAGGKEERKAAELWGFAAWNIREGVFDFTYQLSRGRGRVIWWRRECRCPYPRY